jgi:hypothetical protein
VKASISSRPMTAAIRTIAQARSTETSLPFMRTEVGVRSKIGNVSYWTCFGLTTHCTRVKTRLACV